MSCACRAFRQFIGSVALVGAALASEFNITDIGLGTANDVNSAGQVAASIQGQATLFDGYNNQPLPPPGSDWIGPPFTEATALHDSGLVILNGYHGALLAGNHVIDYTTGDEHQVTAVNVHRTVVGYWVYPWYAGHGAGFVDTSASGGSLMELSYFSRLQDINDAGVAVGLASTNYTVVPEGPPRGDVKYFHPARAMRLVGGVAEFIDDRPAPAVFPRSDDTDLSEALGINGTGSMVGWRRETAPGPRRAFRFEGSGLQDLGTLGGTESVALDLNNAGLVVGWSHIPDGSSRAFLYEQGVMIDLNTRLPAGSGWTLLSANAINDAGQIVGEGLFEGNTHAFLLSPPGLERPPRIIEQPVGGVFGLGDSVTLKVSAVGTPPLVYQWQKDTQDLEGEVSETLSLVELDAFDSGAFRVRVANGGGFVFSETAVVQVSDPVVAIQAYAGISVFGEVGATYRVEYKEDASDPTWLPLASTLLTNSPQVVIDPTPVYHRRVYQAVRLP